MSQSIRHCSRSHRGRALVIGSAVLASVAAAAPASGQVQYRAVALSGQAAPGVGAGLTYHQFVTPTINDDGIVAYLATFQGPGVTSNNNQGIYTGSPGSSQLVRRSDTTAVGTSGGEKFIGFGAPVLGERGDDVAFAARLYGGNITLVDNGYYAGDASGIELVAREGQSAPDAGARYSSLPGLTPAFADGRIAYRASAGGLAIFHGPPSSPRLLARSGAPAPGTSAGVVYEDFRYGPSVGAPGQVAFFVQLGGTGVTLENMRAIYAGSPTSLHLVARGGMTAPGTDAKYEDLGRPVVNGVGQIAYMATRLTGGSVTPDVGGQAIFAGSASSPQLVARRGDPAPGAGADVTYWLGHHDQTPVLNNRGDVAFISDIAGAGVDSSNNTVLFAGTASQMRVMARQGMPAPGAIDGARYSTFTDFQLNDDGQLAFKSILIGDGMTNARNLGLYLSDPVSGQFLIAREGDAFDIGGGELRTISDGGIRFSTTDSASDDPLRGLVDGGRIAFSLSFTDGSNGVFVATVPEPGGLMLLGLIAAMAMPRRSRLNRQ